MSQLSAVPDLSFGMPFPWVHADGELVAADDARLSVLANVVSYGTGTFEGIRATWNPSRQELYLLEAGAHYERMARSARILGLSLPSGDLVSETVEMLRRNDVRRDAYVRPLLMLAGEQLGVRMHDSGPVFRIAATPMPAAYINTDGVRCTVSSWRRSPDAAIPNRAKVIGGYVGPALAKTEAIRSGYDEALLLTVDGYVAEATTSNILIRDRTGWATPPPSDDILEGITRRQVMDLLDGAVVERRIHRSELYGCDEALLCGTAAGVVPVVSVDGRPVGDGRPGDATVELQRSLRSIASGEDHSHASWIIPVYEERS